MKRLATIIAALAMVLAGNATPLRADDLADCKSGEPERVITGCTRLLEAGTLEPFYQAHAYNSRGAAFKRSGDLDRAIADYNRAIEINPEHDQAYNNRGLVYLSKRQYGRAIADFDRAIALNPKRWQAYVNRGVTHSAIGEYGRAIADYTKAMDLNPHYPIALMNRSYAHGRNGNPERALADIEAALSLDPDNVRIRLSLGDIYFYASQPDKARDAWESACRLASEEVTRSWQESYSAGGHYAGNIDGTCDSRLIEAFRSCAREKCFLLF